MVSETTIALPANSSTFLTKIPAEVRDALKIRQGWKLVWSVVGHVALVTVRPLTPEELKERIKDLKER